jgi:ATP-binding cassette subfamily G (WHITE) protein 1/ATP-binding cassette subfamily G (WHITE) protein 2
LTRSLRKKATYEGNTIVITLHQPSFDMFTLCDQTILLARGGRVAFAGAPHDLALYLSATGHDCPPFENPPDFAVTLIGVGNDELIDALVAAASRYCAEGASFFQLERRRRLTRGSKQSARDAMHEYIFDASLSPVRAEPLRASATAAADASAGAHPSESDGDMAARSADSDASQPAIDSNRRSASPSAAALLSEHQWSRIGPGPVGQCTLLSRRSCRRCIRYPLLFRVRLASTLSISILLGLIYAPLGNDQLSIQSRNGAIFLLLNQLVYGTVGPMAFTFAEERTVFLRERSAGTYSTGAYFVSRLAVELVYLSTFSLLALLIVYWWLGFVNTAAAFFSFMLTTLSVTWAAISIGLFIAAISPNAVTAAAVTVLITIPLYLLAGLFTVQAPVWLAWLRFISPYYYAFSNYAIAAYQDLTLVCTPDQLLPDGTCPYTNGDQVLDLLRVDPAWLVGNWALLWCLWFSFALAAFCALLIVGRPSVVKMKPRRT